MGWKVSWFFFRVEKEQSTKMMSVSPRAREIFLGFTLALP